MMDSRKTIKMSDDFAQEYDVSASTNHWHGPEVLFGLMYEYLKPSQSLLDVGIGTGLSARFFHKAGLYIYGVDGSKEMLKICRKKNITTGLEKVDLKSSCDLFPGKRFDHIISNGVFHIIGDLEPVFIKVKSKIKEGGVFGFTVDDKVQNEKDGYKMSKVDGIFEKKHSESGIMIYKHKNTYVKNLLQRFGFELLKKLKFLAYLDEENEISYYFTAYIAKVAIKE